jgi:hypothetical protein
VIPFAARLHRALLRLGWHVTLWSYPRGWVSLRTFLRVEDAYYRVILVGWWR